MAWLHMHYHSEALRMPAAMEVLVPQQAQGCSAGPYPTLYLLHGQGDDHTSWLRRTSIERYAEGLPLAIVMPAGHLGYYTDMVYGRHYFKFITEELPVLCERMFPLSSAGEDRYIAGAGAGGYGALKAALLAPDTFCTAASLSGTVDILQTYEQLDPHQAADIFGSKKDLKLSTNHLFNASNVLAQAHEQSHDELKLPSLYMWCGREEPHYDANVRFKQHASQRGLSIRFEEGPGAGGWSDWDKQLPRVLHWLLLRKHADDSQKGGLS